jgi:hypothetical protein
MLFDAKPGIFRNIPKPKKLFGSWPREKVRLDVRSRSVAIAASGGWTVAAADMHALRLQVRDDGVDIVIEAGIGDAASGSARDACPGDRQ